MKNKMTATQVMLLFALVAVLTGCGGTDLVKKTGLQPVELKKNQADSTSVRQKYYTDDGLQVEYEVNPDAVDNTCLAYRVGAGDELEIWLEKKEIAPYGEYWNEHIEKFGGMVFNRYQVIIDPQGNINVPLAGELVVDNCSVREIELRLKQALGKYLVDPDIFVKINNYGSYSYSILGEVKKPGSYQIKKPITVSEAIAMGGGITAEGNQGCVYVARMGQKTEKISVTKIWRNNGLEQGMILERNDVVYIPHKMFVSLSELERLSTILANFTNIFFQWRNY